MEGDKPFKNKGGETMRKLFSVVFVVVAILGLLSATVALGAEGYPSKPIKLVVTYNPGGGNDSTARVFSKYAQEFLGEPLIVTNIDGAGGVVGARNVLESKPDGYTLLWMHEALITGHYAGMQNFTWKDFTPICQAASTADVIVVKADSPIKSVSDLIAMAKVNPKKIRMPINIGATTHFEAAAIDVASGGGNLVLVSSGGGADRIQKLLGGFYEAASLNLATALGYIKDGQFRALAVTSPKRSPFLPNVPTMLESGYKVKKPYTLNVYGPSNLPKAMAVKLSQAFEKMCKDPRVKADLAKFASVPSYLNADQLVSLLQEEDEIFGSLAKVAGIGKK